MSGVKEYRNIVAEVLRHHPDARDDDFRLYGWVCRFICPKVMDMPFKMVLWNSSKYSMPSYETITRQRRKLQEEFPELRGKKYEKRQKRQEDYIEYFTKGGTDDDE